jgi:hypothetical protein
MPPSPPLSINHHWLDLGIHLHQQGSSGVAAFVGDDGVALVVGASAAPHLNVLLRDALEPELELTEGENQG